MRLFFSTAGGRQFPRRVNATSFPPQIYRPMLQSRRGRADPGRRGRSAATQQDEPQQRLSWNIWAACSPDTGSRSWTATATGSRPAPTWIRCAPSPRNAQASWPAGRTTSHAADTRGPVGAWTAAADGLSEPATRMRRSCKAGRGAGRVSEPRARGHRPIRANKPSPPSVIRQVGAVLYFMRVRHGTRFSPPPRNSIDQPTALLLAARRPGPEPGPSRPVSPPAVPPWPTDRRRRPSGL
jgi:hypothetical protein